MTNWQLPGDLERLEHRLVHRSREEPSAAVRGRTMAGVQAALRRQRSGGWRMLAAAAAGVLVWLNLSSCYQCNRRQTAAVRHAGIG